MSAHQSLWLCSKLLSHDTCLNSFGNRRSVWSINVDTRRGCSKQAYPACHAVTLFAKCVCMCVCVRPHHSYSTRPFGCFRVFSGVHCYHVLHCVWWCTFEGTACMILALKMKVRVMLRVAVCCIKKKNQTPQLWLSWAEQQLRAHLWPFAVISSAKLGSRIKVVHFLNVLSAKRVHVWGEEMPHIAWKWA